MPRIRPLTRDEVAEEYRPAFEQAERSMGAVPGGMGIQAYCPPILEASRGLSAAPARSGTLQPLIRSFVCLRAAQLAGAPSDRTRMLPGAAEPALRTRRSPPFRRSATASCSPRRRKRRSSLPRG